MQDLLRDMPPPWEQRDVVDTFGAYTVERVSTQWDYELEGFYLAHCLGTKDADEFNRIHRVFSIREAELGIPHATILAVKKGKQKHSPYGICSDLGSHANCMVRGDKLRVLQVRGRHDALARPEFLSVAAAFYCSRGGRLRVPLQAIQKFAERKGDQDVLYHYHFLMGKTNPFTYAHWKEEPDEGS